MSRVPQPLFGNIDNQDEIKPLVIDYLENNSKLSLDIEYDYAERFLKSYCASHDTYKSYRREVERLLQWCWFEAGILLYDLDRDKLDEYLKYAFAPPKSMIASKSASRFILKEGIYLPNIAWRPYLSRQSKVQMNLGIDVTSEYLMSNSARKALFAGVSTFCTYLLQEGYLSKNPVALLRQKSRYIVKKHSENITRKLTDLQWYHVIDAIKTKAKLESKYERHLFIISMFYLLGLRISELASTELHKPIMGDFSRDKDGLWWLTVIGKGNKMREIAVPDSLLETLKRYRKFLCLTPLPLRGEQTPILHNFKSNDGLSIRQIRTIVQECFDLAVSSLMGNNKSDAAEDLMAATVHWLRHTSISADVKIRPRDHVRDDAGHESISTTDKYIDIDRVDRHKSAQGKSLYPDGYQES